MQHGFHDSSKERHVLLALKESEKKLFFSGRYAALEGASIESVCEEDLAKGVWNREHLTDWRPEILVTGWSTPPLPADWVIEPKFPLRYVCHVAGSVRGIIPRIFFERGGLVTNWGDAVAPFVAEHALLLALAALRNLPLWKTGAEEAHTLGTYVFEHISTRTLYGRRVGFHGFGRIARALLKLLEPFHVKPYVFSRGVPASYVLEQGATPCSSLKEVFEKSEILFECEALTPETEKTVTAEILMALPNDAVFVNVGRGSVVDEESLLSEARSGRIRIAVDVIVNEPAPPDSEFYRLKNVIFSPHIAGPTRDHFEECGTLAWKNIHAFLNGEDLENLVSLEEYDRST
jgi:phosphoglycerate dehydrogenase-like enzyme